MVEIERELSVTFDSLHLPSSSGHVVSLHLGHIAMLLLCCLAKI